LKCNKRFNPASGIVEEEFNPVPSNALEDY